MRIRTILCNAILASVVLPGRLAIPQTNPAPTPATRLPVPVPRLSRRRAIPCWQQVGVLPSVMQQVTTIRETMRGDVATACADNSLSKEQRTDKIDGLHKSARERIHALIPAHQREAMRSCEASRPRPSRIRRRTAPSNDPCGLAIPAQAEPDKTAPPDATPPPAKDSDPGKEAAPSKPSDPKNTDDKVPDSSPADFKN